MSRLVELLRRLFEWLFGSDPPPPVDPPPIDPPPPPVPPPRVDRPWDKGATRGVTAFALALRDRAYIRDFLSYVHGYGYTVVRVGAQTDGWGPMGVPFLPGGPEPGTKEWRGNLDRMLDETARRPNTWVQLIPTFTHKQIGDIAHWRSLCRMVIEVVKGGGYRHVFWEAANEAIHPISHMNGESVDILLRLLKDETGLPVGADHHGDRRNKQLVYPYMWRGSVDYIAFHPPRNPDPSASTYKDAYEAYAGQFHILYDETTCWASDAEIGLYGLKGDGNIALCGRGTEEERKDEIRRQKTKILLPNRGRFGARSKFFFHAIWLIECKGFGWIPKHGNSVP